MTDALALYGAIIGTAAALGALWNIYSGMRDRARLTIKVVAGLIGAAQPIRCLGIEASNVGRRPATLQSYRLLARDGRGFVLMVGLAQRYGAAGTLIDQTLTTPRRLAEGEQHTFLWPLEVVRESVAADPGFRPIWAEVTDGTGRRWRHRLTKNELRLFRDQEVKQS